MSSPPCQFSKRSKRFPWTKPAFIFRSFFLSVPVEITLNTSLPAKTKPLPLKISVPCISLVRKPVCVVWSHCPVAAAAVANPVFSQLKSCVPNMTSVSVMSITMEHSSFLVPLQKWFVSWHLLSIHDREVRTHLQVHNVLNARLHSELHLLIASEAVWSLSDTYVLYLLRAVSAQRQASPALGNEINHRWMTTGRSWDSCVWK